MMPRGGCQLPPAVPASWWDDLNEALPVNLDDHPRLRGQLAEALRDYAAGSVPRPPRSTINQTEAIAQMIVHARALQGAIGQMQQWDTETGGQMSPLTQERATTDETWLAQERATVETWLASWEAWLNDCCELRTLVMRQMHLEPRRGAPMDVARACLADAVFAALEDARLLLAPSRGGYLAEVIRCVFQAADRIDGREPEPRRDLYRRLRALLNAHRWNRRYIEE